MHLGFMVADCRLTFCSSSLGALFRNGFRLLSRLSNASCSQQQGLMSLCTDKNWRAHAKTLAPPEMTEQMTSHRLRRPWQESAAWQAAENKAEYMYSA